MPATTPCAARGALLHASDTLTRNVRCLPRKRPPQPHLARSGSAEEGRLRSTLMSVVMVLDRVSLRLGSYNVHGTCRYYWVHYRRVTDPWTKALGCMLLLRPRCPDNRQA